LPVAIVFARFWTFLFLPFHGRTWKFHRQWGFSLPKSFRLAWSYYSSRMIRGIWRWKLKVSAKNLNKYVNIVNETYFKNALAAGRGVILVSAHTFAFHLFQLWINLSYRPQKPYLIKDFPEFEADLLHQRQLAIFQGRLINSRTGIIRAVRILQDNGLVILCQDVERKTAEPVLFLGKEKKYPLGAARLAEITDALLLPVIIAGDIGSGKQTIYFQPPLDPEDGELKLRLLRALEEMTLRHLKEWEYV